MTDIHFEAAVEASILNGDRLADDAQTMLDCERYPTAYALAILAEEEYAKALLLSLVQLGALPWSSDVQRALRDHVCKQLAAALLDYLCPEVEEFIRRHIHGKGLWEELPRDVVDAIHVIVHERIPRDRHRFWIGAEDPPLATSAKAIADGKIDRRKQDAIYVHVGGSGQVLSTPQKVGVDDAGVELDRARRIGSGLRGANRSASLPPHADAVKLVDIFRLLTGQLSPQEFSALWPIV